MDTPTTTKSFWQRPEGVTGKVFLVALLLGGGFLLFSVLPTLILLMQNTIYAGILLAVIAGVAYMAMDSNVQNLVSYSYKGMMRGITKAFVQLDPIAILKSYIQDLKKNKNAMNEQVTNLRGQMQSLKRVIDDNTGKVENTLKMATQAEKKGVQAQVVLNSRKAGRLQKSNMTLQGLYTKMEVLYRVLAKMYESSSVLIEDIEDEVSVKEQERKAILAGHSAFKSAFKIISGDTDKKVLFDQAMEVLVDDYGAKVGEMERIMEISANFMSSVDLQNGVFEEDGLRLLEEWQKEGPSLLLGPEKSILISKAESRSDQLDLNAPLVSQPRTSSRYQALLEEKHT